MNEPRRSPFLNKQAELDVAFQLHRTLQIRPEVVRKETLSRPIHFIVKSRDDIDVKSILSVSKMTGRLFDFPKFH